MENIVSKKPVVRTKPYINKSKWERLSAREREQEAEWKRTTVWELRAHTSAWRIIAVVASRWMQICAQLIRSFIQHFTRFHSIEFLTWWMRACSSCSATVMTTFYALVCFVFAVALLHSHRFGSWELYLKRIRFTLMVQCKRVCKSFWFIFHRFQSNTILLGMPVHPSRAIFRCVAI